MNALLLRNVTLRRNGADLLRGMDLEVQQGTHLAVVGPNGSGKTSMLRVLAGVETPTTGVAQVVGERIGSHDDGLLRRAVAVVSTDVESDDMDMELDVMSVVTAGLDNQVLPWRGRSGPGAVPARVRHALARVGVDDLAEQPLGTCSSGEVQRVRLARALVTEPKVLLLDEPFAGLDIGGREELLLDLERIVVGDHDLTVVLVTHRLEEIPRGMDRAAVLQDGRVLTEGSVDRVLSDEVLSNAFGLPLHVVDVDGRRIAMGRS